MSASPTATPCRPDAGRSPTPRRSRMGRRRALVLVGVHLAVAAHLAHWLSTGRTLSPLEPSEAMEFAKHSIVNAGLVFFALATLSTLLFGRFFCGWGCHVVALQDLCRALLLRVGIRPRPLRSRALAWVPFLAFVYMFVWPLVARLAAGDDLGPRGTALTTADFWRTFPPWWGALATFLVCGFAAVYLLGAKGFCTYGCPYGALFAGADRLSPTRIRVTDACEGCGHCTATCSSNVDVAREVHDYGMVVDPGCMKCLDCVSVCPTNALYVGLGRPALGARPAQGSGPHARRRGLPWATELALAVVFLAAFLAYRGLYAVVPLLMALGLAGCLALGARTAWRVARREDVALPGLALVRAGRRTAAGALFLGVAALVGAHSAHAGWVQLEGWRSARHFAYLEGPRGDFFSTRRAPLDEAQRAHAAGVLEHGGRALRASLLPDARREVELAWARLLTGDGAAFERHMTRAIEHGRRPAVAHLELGNHLRAGGRLDETATHYARALEIDPALAFAYPMLADVLTQLGRVDEVEAVLARGVAAHPRDLPLRGRLADLLLREQRADEALALLAAGVAAAPDDPAPLRVLAFARLGLGDLDEAEEALRRAARLPDPNGETARLAERLLRAREAR